MNTLLDLESKLRSTGSAIGRLEAAFAQRPSRVTQANLLSLRKLQLNLQEEFDAAADVVGRDVCRYRLLSDRPSLRALTGVLGAFQSAFSQVFESVHEKSRKDRRTISDASEYLSSLEVAYAFPGSFGLALTIPNSRLLLDIPSELDRAAIALLELITADEPTESILKMVSDFGRAPVAAIYEWAKMSADTGSGAGIQWVGAKLASVNVVVQMQQFAKVSAVLETTARQETSVLVVDGILVGADISSHRFHFVRDDSDESIRGRFDEAISQSQQARLPARYRATVQRTSEIKLATNTESVTYFLESLATG